MGRMGRKVRRNVMGCVAFSGGSGEGVRPRWNQLRFPRVGKPGLFPSPRGGTGRNGPGIIPNPCIRQERGPDFLKSPGSENLRLLAMFALGLSVGICLALLYLDLSSRFF